MFLVPLHDRNTGFRIVQLTEVGQISFVIFNFKLKRLYGHPARFGGRVVMCRLPEGSISEKFTDQ